MTTTVGSGKSGSREYWSGTPWSTCSDGFYNNGTDCCVGNGLLHTAASDSHDTGGGVNYVFARSRVMKGYIINDKFTALRERTWFIHWEAITS